MYPGTIFEYEDQSAITKVNINDSVVRPVYMCTFTSDKGPEDFKMVEGEEFFKLYGNDISFTRHGQPLLQAAMAVNSGGTVFAKRIVAEDSALANTVLVAELKTVSEQKKNAQNQPLYKDANGLETTEATDKNTSTPNTAIMITKANIKYTTRSVAAMSSAEVTATTAAATIAGETPAADTKLYPLFCFCDTGRGVSNKKWRISPDYVSSKSNSYLSYLFNVIENGSTLESIAFALNPEKTAAGKNISAVGMINNNSKQVKVVQYETEILAFLNAVGTSIGMTQDEIDETDVLFGTNKKGVAVPEIVIDSTSVAMSAPAGIGLSSGSDGAFGAEGKTPMSPSNAAAYAQNMAKVFTGGYGNEIYDLDKYKIDVIIDANYPASVKRAIEAFVTFREDCMFFRDLGTGLTTLEAIKAACNEPGMINNKFISTYCTTYDIIDPYSKKQIHVTSGYSLTRLMAPHFASGRARPLAGLLNNFIFTDAIKGTVNFTPVITPSVNEKTDLEDLRVNYASYYDNNLVVETCYTSQDLLSEFSFVNNILAIQEVIKAIRSYCPKIRYGFIDGDDLEKYKADVQSVINKYTSSFMSITLEYIADTVYAANRIFYAAIKVKFRKFAQTELFKVIALGD